MSEEHEKTVEEKEKERILRAINHKHTNPKFFTRTRAQTAIPAQQAKKSPSGTMGLTWSQVCSFVSFFLALFNLSKTFFY